jgi:hypothetical protein
MMMLSGSLRKIRMLAPVCLTVVLVAFAAEAQQKILWQGAVNRERINVYASPSTREQVTATLKSGDVVNVILEIGVMGDEWCRITSPSQPEPLGYVLCFNLEEGRAKQIVRSEPVATHSPAKSTSQPETTDVSAAVLTNKDILDMHKAGLPPEILVAKIKSGECHFDTSPVQLKRLKAAGLADPVILAMVQAPVAAATSAVREGSYSKPETEAKVEVSPSQPTLDCTGVSEDECERRIVQLSQTNCSGVSTAECRNRIAQIMQTSFRQRDPNLKVSVTGNDNEIIVFNSAKLFGEPQSFATDAVANRLFCTLGFSKVSLRPYGEEFDVNCSRATEAKSSAASTPSSGTNFPRPEANPAPAAISHAKPAGGLSKNASKLCAKHPDWTAHACEIIAQHKITVGMTREQVRQALQTGFSGWLNQAATGGRRTSLTHTAEGDVEVWDYSVPASFYEGRQISRGSTFYVYFTNGTCTGWTQGN